MVMTAVKTATHPVVEAGEKIGIKVKVRPWWGSIRLRAHRVCLKCGNRLDPHDFCVRCYRYMRREEVELQLPFPRQWLCSGDFTYSHIKWPEVQNGIVIMWEGQCGVKWNGRRHKHRQDLEVIDVAETAFLLKISVSRNSSHFLIGADDSHPFITPVLRKYTTVQDAFDWLVPNKVREALVLGKDVKRQGDWFFIPTDEPKWYEYRHPFYEHETGFLYRNYPLWYGSGTRHTASLVVYKHFARLPYATSVVKGNVKAPDHPTLHLDAWHIGIRTRTTTGGGSGSSGLD